MEAALEGVRDVLAERLGRSVGSGELATLDIDIATPPPSSKGRICSNAPFAAAAYCNGKSGQTLWQPAEVAAEMLAFIDREQLQTKSYFDCFVGGPGHINAEVDAELGYDLLSAVTRGEIFPFYDQPSLLEGVGFDDALAARQVLDYKEALKDWWLHIAKKKFADSELEAIAREVSSAGEKTVGARVQLLAALANEQIDTGAYLAGVGGKENIPWYIGRFLQSSSAYLEQLALAHSEDGIEVDIQCWCGDGLEAVLCARYEFRRGVETQDPARLMRHVLSCVNAFFRYYNHPSFRNVVLDDVSRLIVFNLTKALRSIVEQGLGTLELA
jgi:hypothetical protein